MLRAEIEERHVRVKSQSSLDYMDGIAVLCLQPCIITFSYRFIDLHFDFISNNSSGWGLKKTKQEKGETNQPKTI